MSAQAKIAVLKEMKFFQDLPEESLTQLSQMCREVRFPARTIIFEEYSPAKDVYFLLDGKVSLAICEPTDLSQFCVLEKDDLLGWSPLLDRTRFFDTARAETDVKAISFDANELLRYCKQDTAFGVNFMRRAAEVLSERLIATRRELAKSKGCAPIEVPLESD